MTDTRAQVMLPKARPPINLHQIEAKNSGKLKFTSLTAIRNPRLGVDYIPPLTAGLLNKGPVKSIKFKSTGPLPKYFNWCDQKSVKKQHGENKRFLSTQAGDQGQCGICWSYSTVAAFADRWYLLTGEKKEFSPTSLGSCMYDREKCEMGSLTEPACCGCFGGLTYLAAAYLKSNGVSTVACQPFADTVNYDAQGPLGGMVECATTCPDPYLYKAADEGSLTDPTKMKQEILSNGPIIGSFIVYQDFMTPGETIKDWGESLVYVHDPMDNSMSGGHAVVIVGWGKDPIRGMEYWIVRNSWTAQWNPNNYVDSDDGRLKLPGFYKIAITGLNPTRPNEDVCMDSSDKFGGAVWATPNISSFSLIKGICSSDADCPDKSKCLSDGMCKTVIESFSATQADSESSTKKSYTKYIIISLIILLILLLGLFLYYKRS